MDPITRAELNRTTLHRQWLLERATAPAARTVEHLVGMQGQNPHDPYWGLWSRLDGFQPDELSTLISNRQAVRGQLLRATIHLATTSDFLGLRPQLQPVVSRTLGSTSFARDTSEIDRPALLAAGRSLLEKEPLTRAELGRRLGSRWPEVASASLAQVVTYLLPVVQVPPRGLWGQSGTARWTTIQSWVGSDLFPGWSVEETVLRYLAVFGPASTSDIRIWSGLPGLKAVIDRLRRDLRTYRSESGTELLDLPDLEVIDGGTPAPPRFLPEYDNLLLGHADRSRFFVDGVIPLGFTGNLMVDGLFSGAWKIVEERKATRLEITMLRKVTSAQRREVTAEGERLLGLVAPDQGRPVMVWREL
jgi:hypothetical protein